ncbi:MAG: NapC/NirT family cytochrome c [Nitrospinae bacterium]|nr:NapC/NirT family cytochrome c [Nitrospinota bacterium]
MDENRLDIDEGFRRPAPSRGQIFAIVFLTGIGLSLFYGLSTLSFHYSSTNKFCSSQCHEMVEPFQQYLKSSHYDSERGVVADCADCHLPPGEVNRWYAKVRQGVKDTVMHFFLKPEDIDHQKWKVSAVKNIRSESCERCHKNLFPSEQRRGGFLAHRAFKKGEVKSCLNCHVNLVHVRREI